MRTVKDNFWLDEPYEPDPPLSGEGETDVAIIGGGVTGMATAYFMKERFPDKRIILLEGEFIGFGSSRRNAGIGTTLLGHNILPILEALGREKTASLHRLSIRSISLLEELIEQHGIACDFERNGLLLFAETDRQVELLETKARAYEAIEGPMTWLSSDQVRSRIGALNARAAMYSPDDRMLNPGKFVRGMKRVVQSLGVEVYEHSRCTRLAPGPWITLYTHAAAVRTRNVVLATHAYGNPLGLFRYKILPFHVYLIGTTATDWPSPSWPERCSRS